MKNQKNIPNLEVIAFHYSSLLVPSLLEIESWKLSENKISQKLNEFKNKETKTKKSKFEYWVVTTDWDWSCFNLYNLSSSISRLFWISPLSSTSFIFISNIKSLSLSIFSVLSLSDLSLSIFFLIALSSSASDASRDSIFVGAGGGGVEKSGRWMFSLFDWSAMQISIWVCFAGLVCEEESVTWFAGEFSGWRGVLPDFGRSLWSPATGNRGVGIGERWMNVWGSFVVCAFLWEMWVWMWDF